MRGGRKMTRQEFKKRWESNEDGGGITMEDVANCAVKWGLIAKPKILPINKVLNIVLKSANIGE